MDNSNNKSMQNLDNKELIREFNDPNITKLFDLLSMEAEIYIQSQKSTKQIFKSNAQK